MSSAETNKNGQAGNANSNNGGNIANIKKKQTMAPNLNMESNTNNKKGKGGKEDCAIY